MVKRAADVKVIKKRNGRYSVKKRGGGLLKADEKVKVLQDKGLLKKMTPKKKTEEAPAAT